LVLLVGRGGARVVEVDAMVWSVGAAASAGMVGALVNVTLRVGGDVGCCGAVRGGVALRWLRVCLGAGGMRMWGDCV
jgi:hypothetical protein